jgi:hypothetical protein
MKTHSTMKIEEWPIDKVVAALDSDNPRIITTKQLDSLRAGIKKFGFLLPVIFNEQTGKLIGGHQRLKAAQLEGLVTIPVTIQSFDPSSARRLNIGLNRITGKWDFQILEEVLSDLAESEAIIFSGFSEQDIVEIMSDYSDVPEESFEEFASRFSSRKSSEFVAFRSSKAFFTCSKGAYESLIQRLYAEVGVDDIAASVRFFKLIGLE